MPQRFESDVEHQLLRIGQEAVLNAVRHSNAQTVELDVNYKEREVILRVSDDGCGFDGQPIAEGTSDHYGITTMRERAEQVGGRVTISSAPGRGTTVEAIVPMTLAESA